MERTREGALTFSDRGAVVVLRPRPLDPASSASIDANDRELLSALVDDLTERAKTAAEEIADFHEAAASGEPLDRLLLCGSPLKPTRYLCPVHERFQTDLINTARETCPPFHRKVTVKRKMSLPTLC